MKIAIIGAGAAGCFAAANIPSVPGLEISLFEKTGKALQKVKVSGGGRCNVTHQFEDTLTFSDCYPRGKQLLKKTLHHFSPLDTMQWFTQRGVALKTEEDGRVFPVTDNSQTIIDCIWQEMMRNKVQVYYHKAVAQIEKDATGKWLLRFSDGSGYQADKVLVAAGGFPKPQQYEWIEALGHAIQSPAPSLFTFNIPGHPVTSLMGISVPRATLRIMGTKITQSGPLLITHWGMSGPAVLKTSAIAARELATRNYDFSITVNWLDDITDADLRETLANLRREQGSLFVSSKNAFGLPARLWSYLLEQCGIKDNVRWGELPAGMQNKLIEHLLRDTYHIKGKTTFKEEFVTCGGVALSGIDPQTMESRTTSGIYFAGEVMDADGITGGYNFQHAWSSGWIAAQNMAKKDIIEK